MAKGKTVTIRVSEDTFEQIKGICTDLGESYNFNQFVNQSLGAILKLSVMMAKKFLFQNLR